MAGTAENSKREGFVKEIEAQILSGKLKPGERLEAERELALRLTPLPQLMEELAHRTEEPARRLFSACRRALDGLERETFAHAWRRLTDQLPVSPEAKRALYPLGEVLGRYDGRGQQAAIAGARRELEGLRARAGEERLRLGKVYGALGVTAGAFLVILLL